MTDDGELRLDLIDADPAALSGADRMERARAVAALDVVGDRVGKAHRNARDTEAGAAASVGMKTGTQRHAVLLALREHRGGLTDDEVAEETGLYLYSAAPRRNELLNSGYIEDSGERRLSRRGRPAIVWRCTAAGFAWPGAS